jgi:hypothetical protein
MATTRHQRVEKYLPPRRKCPYCGKWWTPGPHKFRVKWHDCKKAQEARRIIEREKQKEYDEKVRPQLQNSKKKLRKSMSSDRHLVRLADGAKLYECKSKVSNDCWGKSPNRFNCPACLEKLENTEDICIDVLGYAVYDPPNMLL